MWLAGRRRALSIDAGRLLMLILRKQHFDFGGEAGRQRDEHGEKAARINIGKQQRARQMRGLDG